MSKLDDPPLSSTSLAPMPDFETIEAAVRETARGRAFLDEYDRRCRAQEKAHASRQETQTILAAIDRLEAVVKSQALDAQPQRSAQNNGQDYSGAVISALAGQVSSELAAQILALAQKLKLRGQAPDIAEKLCVIAQSLTLENGLHNLSHTEKIAMLAAPQSTVQESAPPQNAVAQPAPMSDPLSDPSFWPVTMAKPEPVLKPNDGVAETPVIPAVTPPIKAKSPAFFLPAMEITNLDEAVATSSERPQASPELPQASFDALPSAASLAINASVQHVEDTPSHYPLMSAHYVAPNFASSVAPPRAHISLDFNADADVHFDIQTLADIDKLSEEERLALFC